MARVLQRLFSTFPSGWPGFGLLLLRACLGTVLIRFGLAMLGGESHDFSSLAPSIAADAGGVFLLAGLWTPLMGSVTAIGEMWIAFSAFPRWRDDAWIHMFLAVLAVSVAMTGPGAWSIDARLFGRKRFDMNR